MPFEIEKYLNTKTKLVWEPQQSNMKNKQTEAQKYLDNASSSWIPNSKVSQLQIKVQRRCSSLKFVINRGMEKHQQKKTLQ